MADHELNIVIKGKNQTGNLFGSVTSGITALNQALEIARKVAEALQKVYDAAKEGADLLYAEQRFDSLATSIGTVSDALMVDLREASRGLVSDAELVSSAADFMALGLANSHDEVVRLTKVAGALGMNMNQLVLTLTNQTTMRFDALGVSVAGFDDKVKALEESGMSASDAFAEAFLQQAEEQIERVGERADSAAASFDRLEAAQKNYSDTIKKSLTPLGQFYAETQTLTLTNDALRLQWLDLRTQAKDLGIDVGDLGKAFGSGGMVKDADAAREAIDNLNKKIQASKLEAIPAGEAVAIYYEKMAQTQILKDAAAAMQGATVETDNLTEATDELSVSAQQAIDDYNLMVVELEKITGLDQNFSGIISYARKYDDILKEIQGNETRITELMGTTTTEGIAERDALIAKNAELSQQMTDMANQVVLDMFAATIAIGGVTDAELEAYFTLAEEMGIISKEAADEAIAQYKRAEDYVREHQFPDQTFQIIGQLVMPDIPMGGSGSGGGWVPFHNEAAGGVVSAAAGAMGGGAYYVGEIGPELFFPAQNGRVVSNSEAKASLRSGRGGGETIVVNINTPMNFADKAWVERELAPYITKAIRSERIRG